jgi:hypothetical protein
VQLITNSANVRPGHKAAYAIWVWSTRRAGQAVTVKIRIAHVRHVAAPHFTVCPHTGSATCRIGTLATGKADELQATAKVGKAAAAGEQVQLIATVSGKAARSFQSSATAVVRASAPPSSGSPPPTTVTLPPVSLPPVSGIGGGAPGDPTGLFPTVSPAPSSSPSDALGFPPAAKRTSRARAATVAAIVPLDPRLIGGQLAGLAVLAGAVAIAITRLSLRRPKSPNAPEDQDKTT